MRVAVTRSLFPSVLEELDAVFDEVWVSPHDRPLSQKELSEVLNDYDVVIGMLVDRVDSSVLNKTSSLKCLITYSVGVDHLDVNLLRSRGVEIVHTPAVLTHATAELAMALMFACSRRLLPAADFVKRNRFTGFSPELFLGIELYGATLGVVGMGKIGQAMAEKAVGLGMNVLYCGNPKSLSFNAKHCSLETLLRSSQVVSLHCPLTSDTRHLIGKESLSLMPDNGILINTARGPVVDESALVLHLREHPAFFAGIDVYEFEPEISKELVSLENVVCLPHVGSATFRARQAMAEICVLEAIRFGRGEPLHYSLKETR